MGHSHRSHTLRFLALATLVVLGSVFSPAADFVSAAGFLHRDVTVPQAHPLSVSGMPAEDDDFITVFLPIIMRRWPPIAYAPSLTVSEDAVWDAPIVLDWQAEVPVAAYPITSYVLEESSSADFVDVTESFTLSATSVPYTITKPTGEMGNFYYRVRGNNAWGDGDWSNVASTWLLSIRDEFDYGQTDWSVRRTSYHGLDKMPSWYEDGEYNTVVGDKYDFAVFSPLQAAPQVPYVMKMRTKVAHEANETSFGMVFGGNEGDFCEVVLDDAADPNGCFYHYYRLNVIWGGYLKYGLTRVDAHEGYDGKGLSGNYGGYSALQWYEGNAHDWNEWEIRVYESGYELYVNGHFLKAIADPTYVHEPYYGIFGSNFEYNGGHFRHQYFTVEPLDAAPQALSPELQPLTGSTVASE